MSQTPYSTPPGWYQDQSGHLRWWDGQAWGIAAAPQPQSTTPPQTNLQAPQTVYTSQPSQQIQTSQLQPMPQLSHIAQIQRAPKTKPAISRLSIAGLILSVAVWIVWLLDTYTPRPVAERCQTQECWDGLANGTINLTPAPTLPQILGWFVTPMLLTAIGLAIAGMIRSTKRPVPIIALAVSLGTILLMILPSLLMLFGLSIYGVMGASGAFG